MDALLKRVLLDAPNNDIADNIKKTKEKIKTIQNNLSLSYNNILL